jgi:hypothetical protein
MRLARVGLVLVAVSALTLGACGGDDSDSGASVSEAEYVEALTSAFSRRSERDPIANTEQEAQCTAETIVDDVGQERLEDAGLTVAVLESDTFGTDGFPDLEAGDASTIVDAIFDCINVGATLGAQLVAGGPSETQAQCLDDKLKALDAFHAFYESILRQGNRTTMDMDAASAVVDTMFECIGQGEFFRASVADSITLTDEQVACLDESLASSTDYRDALVVSFTGGQPPSGEPAFREEVERCVTAEQLTPTTTG